MNRVASILMYEGPTISDLLANTNMVGKKLDITKHKDGIILNISYKTAYQTEIEDQYFFNEEQHLIKQILKINNKEHEIFNKFKEATKLLHSYENDNNLVSVG